MGLISTIFGFLFGGGRNAVAQTHDAFARNADAADQRDANVQQQAMSEFGAEFQNTGGWFNDLVNGLNRLPRPVIAFGVIGLLASSMVDPIWFSARMQGLTLVPDPLWQLVGLVIGFYFGGRELHYFRQAGIQKAVAASRAAVPQVVQNIQALRALRHDSPQVANVQDPGETTDGNAAVDAYLAQK